MNIKVSFFLKYLAIKDCLPFVLLVALLELMMPLVEINVENNEATGGKPSHQIPLIMREREGADAAITGRICIENSEVMCAPNLHNTIVSTHYQVLTITAHDHALHTIIVLHVLELFAVDSIRAESTLAKVDNDVALPGEGDEARRQLV